jgi:uncharacterized membrane protein YoaT (DUF817 family)
MIQSRRLPLERWGRDLVEALRRHAGRGRLTSAAFEILMFGLKQGWACLFGASLLALLLGTHLFYPMHAAISRYDFMLLAAFAIQGAMLALKLERPSEALVILIFHVAGTVMEVFKTGAGSWSYPEQSLFHIGGVPLFSGFMYSAVGSFIARSFRILDVRFSHYPPPWTTWVLAGAVYLNFFTHHYLPDIRIGLFALSALLFWRSWIFFTPDLKVRRMPLLLGLFLVALFIWFAENIATFSHAWVYPSQRTHWAAVSPAKLGAWYLLMLISFVLVGLVHRSQAQQSVTRLSRTGR